MKSILCVLVVSVFCGCASTPEELKAKPAGFDTFETNETPQAVYRKIKTNAERKYGGGHLLVTSDFWPESNSGEVSCISLAGVSRDFMFTVEIAQIDDKRTKVTTYYLLNTWKKIAREVRGWCNVD